MSKTTKLHCFRRTAEQHQVMASLQSRQSRPTPMAKLAELKLKRVQQLNTADSSLVIRKHKEVLNWMMRTFGLDTYGLTWAQFAKGLGLGALGMWLLLR